MRSTQLLACEAEKGQKSQQPLGFRSKHASRHHRSRLEALQAFGASRMRWLLKDSGGARGKNTSERRLRRETQTRQRVETRRQSYFCTGSAQESHLFAPVSLSTRPTYVPAPLAVAGAGDFGHAIPPAVNRKRHLKLLFFHVTRCFLGQVLRKHLAQRPALNSEAKGSPEKKLSTLPLLPLSSSPQKSGSKRPLKGGLRGEAAPDKRVGSRDMGSTSRPESSSILSVFQALRGPSEDVAGSLVQS